MTLKQILDWYEGIDEERRDSKGNVVDIDKMLHVRKTLAVIACKIADHAYRVGVSHASAYNEKKLAQAVIEMDDQGTAAQRKAKAIKETILITQRADKMEAELRGYKIKLDQVNKVLDSMSAYINAMRTL